MSAVLSEFQFTFDAGCVGQMPLRLFPEPQSKVIEAAKPEMIDSRSLVDLYDELLSATDKERRVSVKTIRDNRSAIDKFETWAGECEKNHGRICIWQKVNADRNSDRQFFGAGL